MHVLSPYQIILFAAGLICFGAFVWGVKGHFRSSGKLPPGMRLVSLVSFAGFMWFTLRLVVGYPLGHWKAALVLFAVSLLLFFWAIFASRRTPPTVAFETDQPVFLLRHGPYQYVRHPFYLSYLIFWMATAIAFAGLLPWVAPLGMLAIYQNAASREEGKFAKSDLAAAYAQYRRQAGMFLPRASALLQG
jgi:protein-S-isoprenylcysteine O-methyltransferase Ste14